MPRLEGSSIVPMNRSIASKVVCCEPVAVSPDACVRPAGVSVPYTAGMPPLVLKELVLLDHKLRRWFGGMLRMQHWHRGRVGAMATANRRWMVAIEFGTWRCGRIGGAAGSVTAGNGRFFDCNGAIRS